MSKTQGPAPPEHLTVSSQEVWSAVVEQKDCVVPGWLVLLQMALEARDRAAEAPEIIARDGLFEKDDSAKMAHAHPALKIETEARKQFMAAWSKLQLDWRR